MAWSDISAYVFDQVWGYQSANKLLDNVNALRGASYIAKTASFLTNAQALDVLASGYVKNTTGTGTLSTVASIPAADLPTGIKTHSLTTIIAHFTSPGSGIATGYAGCIVVPWNCTITQVTLLSMDPTPLSGSIVVDIWKDVYANYPPTVADTITASAKPTLSSAIKSVDATLTGWTTALAAGDILAFNVDSVSTVTLVRIELRVTLT